MYTLKGKTVKGKFHFQTLTRATMNNVFLQRFVACSIESTIGEWRNVNEKYFKYLQPNIIQNEIL